MSGINSWNCSYQICCFVNSSFVDRRSLSDPPVVRVKTIPHTSYSNRTSPLTPPPLPLPLPPSPVLSIIMSHDIHEYQAFSVSKRMLTNLPSDTKDQEYPHFAFDTPSDGTPDHHQILPFSSSKLYDENNENINVLFTQNSSTPHQASVEQKSQALTDEQQKVLDFCAAEMTGQRETGKILRVISGAGTGKTTTLQHLSKLLLEKGERVLYLVFSKAAERDARSRFLSSNPPPGSHMEIRTINACALLDAKSIFHQRADSTLASQVFQNIVSENVFNAKLRNFLYNDISYYFKLYAENQENQLQKKKDLLVFWVFKTLVRWMHSESTLYDLYRSDFFTYYPAKLHHAEEFKNCPLEKTYVHFAKKAWDAIFQGKLPMLHDAYMKYAQLNMRSCPIDSRLSRFTFILLDESQDTSACQVAYIIKQTPFAHRILIGDYAQSIYQFRGSSSKCIMSLDCSEEFYLTKSFRFGSEISKVANCLLKIKQHSNEKQNFKAYTLTGTSPDVGIITYKPLPYPKTIIGRSNGGLFIRATKELLENPEVRISCESLSQLKTCLRDIEELYFLYKNEKKFISRSSRYKKFDSYRDFIWHVEKFELNEYKTPIMLIEAYGDKLMEAVHKFESSVLDKAYSPDTCDILITTCHQGKGLEWDHVELLDDFCELCNFQVVAAGKNVNQDDELASNYKKKFSSSLQQLKRPILNEQNTKMSMEWRLPFSSDEINLWYVGVTRARKTLSLPGKWWALAVVQRMIEQKPVSKDLLESVIGSYHSSNPSLDTTSINTLEDLKDSGVEFLEEIINRKDDERQLIQQLMKTAGISSDDDS